MIWTSKQLQPLTATFSPSIIPPLLLQFTLQCLRFPQHQHRCRNHASCKQAGLSSSSSSSITETQLHLQTTFQHHTSVSHLATCGTYPLFSPSMQPIVNTSNRFYQLLNTARKRRVKCLTPTQSGLREKEGITHLVGIHASLHWVPLIFLLKLSVVMNEPRVR